MIFSFPVSPKKSDAKSRQTRAYVKTNYPRVHLFLLGTLIKDVFERRRWTGSEVFSLLMDLDSTIFALLG